MSPVVLCVHPHGDLYGSDRMFLATVDALSVDHRPHAVVGTDGHLAAELRGRGVPTTVRPRMLVLRKAMIRRPWTFLGALPDLLETVRLVRRLGPSWVYVSTVNAPVAVIAARLAGKRVACHVHEAEDFPPVVRAVLLAPLLAVHRILSISAATTSFVLAAWPVLEPRIRRLPNTVASRAVPPRLPATTPDVVRVACVGRLSARKGTDVAIRATAVLRERGIEARLDLHGDIFPGYEPYAESLGTLVTELGLAGHVTFHGFDADTSGAYADAHVCVVPSRQEPFGLVAVEARQAGRITVVSDVGGLPETVDGGASGVLVPPDDPEALADAIEKALRDWPASTERARRSGDRARADYSPARYARDLRAALAGIMR